jgi:hypothetical protein
MNAWLGANCGPDAWAIAPSGSLSVVNDALAIYLLDATIASAFVARSCAAQRIENKEGVSFVSVTQQFNTTSSMGRLTLNVLLRLPSSSGR